MNTQPITERLITRQQMKQFIFSLADISRSVFSTKKSFEKTAKDILPLNMSECLLEYLHTNNVDLKSPRQTKYALDGLSKSLGKLPTVQLTIAWEPTGSQLEQLAELTHRLLRDGRTPGVGTSLTPGVEEERKILLNITVDHAIFAGVIIEYKGKYGDYSLKQKLEEVKSYNSKVKTTT